MSVESRLREATSELDATLSRVPVPPIGELPRSRSLVAAVAVPVALILSAVALLVLIDAPANEVQSGETTTVTTRGASSAPATSAEGTTSPRQMTGPIDVIDPSLTHPDLLAALDFEPDSLGQEYRIAPIDDPESVRTWFQPIVWNDRDWEWTIVGQVAGFEMPVVVARSGAEVVVCAGRESQPLSCFAEGFQVLADGEYSPAVWLAPESTAVVGFAEHDNSAWQIPSGGAVAFPRFHLTGTATLTAYDRAGLAVASIVFDHIVETNSSVDMLPQPPMVDLMRVLLERGVPAIADTTVVDRNAPTYAILGVAVALEVEFRHVDGSDSYAMITGDGVRGVAIWSEDPAQLNLPLEGVPSVENHDEYVMVDLGGLIIVTRGVPLEQIVEIWNSKVIGG
jgi:hypothetical protein